MTQQPPRTAFPLPDTPFDLVVFAASLGSIEALTRYTGLTVMDARPDDWLCPGVVFLALADFHLLIGEGGQLLLTQTTRLTCCLLLLPPFLKIGSSESC